MALAKTLVELLGEPGPAYAIWEVSHLAAHQT
jgi:hypothetical protein